MASRLDKCASVAKQ